MEWMLMPLKRYAEFGGRSRRREYWMFMLFNIAVGIGFGIVGAALGGGMAAFGGPVRGLAEGGLLAALSVANLVFTLAMIIPGVAVAVRRLHDIDRSGWWLLAPLALYVVGLIILVVGGIGALAGASGGSAPSGGIVSVLVVGGLVFAIGGLGFLALLVAYCLPGTAGPNRYGADPKDPEGDLEQVFG